jgi:hypothetical protein
MDAPTTTKRQEYTGSPKSVQHVHPALSRVKATEMAARQSRDPKIMADKTIGNIDVDASGGRRRRRRRRSKSRKGGRKSRRGKRKSRRGKKSRKSRKGKKKSRRRRRSRRRR